MKSEYILKSQVKALYSGVKITLLSAFIVSIGIYFVFKEYAIYKQFVDISLALVIISYLVRTKDVFSYLRNRRKHDGQYWFTRFSVLTLFSAIAWSAFFMAIFPKQESYQVLVSLCVSGIGMSAMAGLCYSRRLIVTYLLLLFSPLMIRLYLQETDFSSELLIFVAAFFIFLLNSSQKMYVSLIDNIKSQLKINEQNKSLQHHQSAIDQHAIVSVTDVKGVITYVNDLFCNISGYTKNELLGQNHRILNSGHHPENFFKEMWQTIAAGNVWQGEVRNKTKSGSMYWVSSTIVPLLNIQGKPQQYISIRTDVSHLKKLEEQERSSHENTLIRGKIAQTLQETGSFKSRLELVLETLCKFKGLPVQNKAGIFLLSRDRSELHMRATYGKFSEEFILKEECINAGDCLCGRVAISGILKVSDDCFVDHEHEHTFEGMTPHGHYIVPLTYSGEVLGVLFLYTEPNPSKEPSRLTTLTNIGQMIGLAIANEQANEALIKETAEAAKANKAKSDFLSSMSHELRTPLNAVLGFSQLLESDTDEPLTLGQKENVGYIINSGKHLLRLINEVLELSAIEAGKTVISVEAIRLIDIINECLILLKNKASLHNIEITILASDQTIYVHADYTKLKQILLNLMSNAIKYNIDGGIVNIDWQVIGNKQVKISVIDKGIGISEENQPFVFGSFNRLGQENSDIEGTGIGLLLTKNLVELMSGNIGFDSTENEGSTFWFELPISDGIEADVRPKSIEISTSNNLGDETSEKDILYVEDNPANRQLMQSFFNRYEHLNLHVTDTAELAWDILAEQTFDLILMDINLPGMDGITFTEILKDEDNFKSIPVIAVTAAAMTHDFKAAKDVFDDYITKPVDFTELTNYMNKYI